MAVVPDGTAVTEAVADESLSAFLKVRPRLLGIACRMLGSAEAEDIVQDVWLRWQAADRRLVRDAAAFLATTTTRLAINVMRSARSRRETCVACLPEPVDTRGEPGSGAERGEALTLAVLVLLRQLSPTERAAFILREAFDYPYRDIAKALRLGEANARQVVARARQRVAHGEEGTRPRCHTSACRPVIAGARSRTPHLTNTEGTFDHETRHHRRHRAYWIEARGQAERTRP